VTVSEQEPEQGLVVAETRVISEGAAAPDWGSVRLLMPMLEAGQSLNEPVSHLVIGLEGERKREGVTPGEKRRLGSRLWFV